MGANNSGSAIEARTQNADRQVALASTGNSLPPSDTQPPQRQNWLAALYVGGQLFTFAMAIASADKFAVALAWIVASLAFTQLMTDHVVFTSPRVKKFVIGACTMIPAIIALGAAYLG